MATRKALVLVSGLFQELNSSSDKLDFAGNSTSDLSEGTNQYFTTARARGSISVTDAGGQGSLAYNSSTGVITYTGPSSSDTRGELSVASGSGLTYNSGTGEFGTNAIPNAQLANSTITLGSDVVSLGDTITGLSLTNIQAITKLQVGSQGGAGNIVLHADNSGGFSRGITFEGASGGADANETLLAVTDPTADRTITLPDATGTVALLSSLSVASGSGLTYNSGTGEFGTNAIPNAQLANSSLTIGSTSVALGATVTNFAGLGQLVMTDLIVGSGAGTANAINIQSGQIIFEGSTADANETILSAADATGGDKSLIFPNESGTLLSTGSSIANSNLANSSITIGSTGIALGTTATTFTGLSSITSTAVVTNDSGFRIRNNSDNSKIGAFSSASITGGQTRTLTFPDADGTIATQAYVNAQITAEDLDIEADSGTIAIDLNSEVLDIEGGTNITTAATGNKVTINMPTAFATESFATAIAVALG